MLKTHHVRFNVFFLLVPASGRTALQRLQKASFSEMGAELEYIAGPRGETGRAHFDEKQLVDLTLAIIAINGWNRMNIAFRTRVGDYVSPNAAHR